MQLYCSRQVHRYQTSFSPKEILFKKHNLIKYLIIFHANNFLIKYSNLYSSGGSKQQANSTPPTNNTRELLSIKWLFKLWCICLEICVLFNKLITWNDKRSTDQNFCFLSVSVLSMCRAREAHAIPRNTKIIKHYSMNKLEEYVRYMWYLLCFSEKS